MKTHSNKKPHVLFVIMHDFGPRYGCYGDGFAVTPTLDGIAEHGVRFAGHYANYPLCGPARANLFTGYRPEYTKRFNNKPFFERFRTEMGEGFKTLPQWFKDHGYRSLGTGFIFHDKPDAPSWSEPYVPQKLPDDLPEWSVPYQDSCPNIYRNEASLRQIRDRAEDFRRRNNDHDGTMTLAELRQCRGPAFEVGSGDDNSYYDGVAAGQAVRWIEEHDPDTPLFCGVGFTATHLPFNVPKKYWDLYDRDTLEPAVFDQSPEGTPEWAEGDSEPVQYYTINGYSLPWKADREQSIDLKHGHYAALSYVDAQIGKIQEALRKKGMLDDTIIVVTSDHGFHDSEHGYWGKHNCWDRSFHIPLLMSIPGREGLVFEGLSEHVDVFPTLCSTAGLDIPGYCQGEDLTTYVYDGEYAGREAVFGMRKPMWHDRLQEYEHCRSVRTSQYRLNTYYADSGVILYRELFDYQADPEERVNIAKDNAALIGHLEALYVQEVFNGNQE